MMCSDRDVEPDNTSEKKVIGHQPPAGPTFDFSQCSKQQFIPELVNELKTHLMAIEVDSVFISQEVEQAAENIAGDSIHQASETILKRIKVIYEILNAVLDYDAEHR